jgi:hypothetical protein
MPEAFSAGVISNAMELGRFHKCDFSKSEESMFPDKFLACFRNKNESGKPQTLLVAPTLGLMKFSSLKDARTGTADVPSVERAEFLARGVLFQLGIDRSLLAPKVRGGYDEVVTRLDKNGNKTGDSTTVSRGVSFVRLIDGIPLSESWCFLIHFGNHERLEDFLLKWQNLLPFESHRTFTVEEIVQVIKAGKAIVPEQHSDLTALLSVTKLKVIKATPRYYSGKFKEPVGFVFPYVELELASEETAAVAEAKFIVFCPLLSDVPIGNEVD